MQVTSSLYKRLRQEQNSYYENRVAIGEPGFLINEAGKRITFGRGSDNKTRIKIGNSIPDCGYGESMLYSLKTTNTLFSGDTPSVGNFCAAEMDLEMKLPAAGIPRMAQMMLYTRITNGTEYSEWIPKGVFFVDTRSITHNTNGIDVITIHGYDAALKTEAFYPTPATDLNWSSLSIDDKTYEHSYYLSYSQNRYMKTNLTNLIGKEVTYTCSASGMQTGEEKIGTLAFTGSGSSPTVYFKVENGGTFTVPENIGEATYAKIYGSTEGATISNIRFSDAVDMVDSKEMVRNIVAQMNQGLSSDIGETDIRRVRINNSELSKLADYSFPAVAGTYTSREVLGMIAAANGGNWFIDDDNTLRFVSIASMFADETFFLTDRAGYRIVIGGDRILVGRY